MFASIGSSLTHTLHTARLELTSSTDILDLCRAWQLFDWVRTLPEGHSLQRLCNANTYSTMITLCGPWQQLHRALQLVAEMRNRSLECGIQVCPQHNCHF